MAMLRSDTHSPRPPCSTLIHGVCFRISRMALSNRCRMPTLQVCLPSQTQVPNPGCAMETPYCNVNNANPATTKCQVSKKV